MFIKAGSIGSAAPSRKHRKPAGSNAAVDVSAAGGRPAGRPAGSIGPAARSLDLMPASRTTLLHFSMSALIWAANSSGGAAHRREAERREPLLDVRQRDDPRQLSGEDIDHGFRGRRRRDQADDQFGFLVVETALGHGRNVGDDREIALGWSPPARGRAPP